MLVNAGDSKTSYNLSHGRRALLLADLSSTTNRIIRSGFSYDAAGNLTNDPGNSLVTPVVPAKVYAYDAENRVKTATVGSTVNSYCYNADGKRVRRTVNGVTTWYVYDAAGMLISEINPTNSAWQKEYVYKGGELLAAVEPGAPNPVCKYATGDHLGTPRVWTKSSGSTPVVDGGGRHDYAPFGEELVTTATMNFGAYRNGNNYGSVPQADGQRKQFTSKERDTETGLDYFGARYYSSTQGRFMSADLPKMDLVPTNPQSMNRYSYVRNNPCRNIDPNGRCSAPAGLQKGQVGICVEAFIATTMLPRPYSLGPYGGRGDGRKPNGNDPTLTARIEAKLIASPNSDGKGFSLSQPQVKAARSEVVIPSPAPIPAPIQVGLQGTAVTNDPVAKVDQNGNTNFTLSGTAKNGFQANNVWGAPGGTIDFNLNFQIDPNGAASVDRETSTTKDYPTYAAYSYQIDGKGSLQVNLLFVRPEKDIGALERKQTPIKEKEQ